VSEVAALDPERLMRTLDKHHVQFILIGALAARLYGFPRLTADADVTPSRDPANLDHLAQALRELDAKIYTESIPEGLAFDCSAAILRRAMMWNLVTKAGRLDIVFEPGGTTGYDDLVKEATRFEAFGVTFLVASLDDIIRSKEAVNRERDRSDVVLLKALKRRLEQIRT
jgi:hypothetical protein